MPEDRTGVLPLPTRRRALGLGLRLGTGAFVAASLAGCGIQLEDDAPRVPGLPTRAPVPGEAFLLTLRQHSTDLAVEARALGGSATALAARLAVLHARQALVLETELVRLGVPRSILDAPVATATLRTRARTTGATGAAPGTTTGAPGAFGATTGATSTNPTGSTATGPSSPAGGTAGPAAPAAPAARAELAALQALDLGPAAIAALAEVRPQTITLAGAVLAQRAAAATLLGEPASWPEPAWSAPSLAASYLESSRAAAYAFEVVAAQSPKGAQRTLALGTLGTLRARARQQEALAGAAATPPALGYPLPFTVTTPAAARTLAVKVLTDLRAAVARDLASTGGEVGPLGAVVQWLADTEVLASRWGVALEPFPGLT